MLVSEQSVVQDYQEEVNALLDEAMAGGGNHASLKEMAKQHHVSYGQIRYWVSSGVRGDDGVHWRLAAFRIGKYIYTTDAAVELFFNRMNPKTGNVKSVQPITYFVQSGTCGPIKIGRTFDMNQRMAGLQSHSGEKLILLATTTEHERKLHRRFKSSRLHGEWFRPTPRLLATIRKCPYVTPEGLAMLSGDDYQI